MRTQLTVECDECGTEYVITLSSGRRGTFSTSVEHGRPDEPPEVTDDECPHCGNPLSDSRKEYILINHFMQ